MFIRSLEDVIRSDGYDFSAEKHLCFLWEHGDGDGDGAENNGAENDGVKNDGVENDGVENCSVENDSVENDSVGNESAENGGVENDVFVCILLTVNKTMPSL